MSAINVSYDYIFLYPKSFSSPKTTAVGAQHKLKIWTATLTPPPLFSQSQLERKGGEGTTRPICPLPSGGQDTNKAQTLCLLLTHRLISG